MGRGAGLAAEIAAAATGRTNLVVGTPQPRDGDGALPGRVCRAWNVETPFWLHPRGGGGGPSVRTVERRAGTGWPKKPKPVAERRQDTVPGVSAGSLPAVGACGTGRIPVTNMSSSPEPL